MGDESRDGQLQEATQGLNLQESLASEADQVLAEHRAEVSSASGPIGAETGAIPKSPKARSSTLLEVKKDVVKVLRFVKRPDYCSHGDEIDLVTNHFQLTFNPMTIYHYDVEIEAGRGSGQLFAPEFLERQRKFRKLNHATNRSVIDTLIDSKQLAAGIVFDGQKNVFSRIPLDGGDQRLSVQLDQKGSLRDFYVNIKFVAMVELASLKEYIGDRTGSVKCPLDVIQALDIILRHGPSRYRTPIGNSLYDASGKGRNIGGGRQLVFGHYQSLRPCALGTTLVVDRTATAFFEAKSITAFVEQYFSERDGQRRTLSSQLDFSDANRKVLKRELKGLEIEVRHLAYRRYHRVVGLSRLSADKITFEYVGRDHGGKELSPETMSVKEYFSRVYKINLKFPNLPCIEIGSTKRKSHLPLEVCHLSPNQHVRKKLTAAQTSVMIKETATQGPEKRFDSINSSVEKVANEGRAYLSEFEITLDTRPLEVKGKRLNTPSLLFGSSRSESPKDGKWDYRGKGFSTPAQFTNWVLVNLCGQNQYFVSNTFIKALKQQANNLGMHFEEPIKSATLKAITREKVSDLFTRAKAAAAERQVPLKLIVFIFNGEEEIYNEIKLIGDTQQHVVSQCLRVNNAIEAKPALLVNLLLKINAKLGGKANTMAFTQPFRPTLMKKGLMVVGVDVTHPAPGDKLSASVAAAVASYDAEFAGYSATIRVQQTSKNEMVEDFKEMMVELLNDYRDKCPGNQLPDRICVYRDGVSECQFESVLDKELSLMKKAFSSIDANYAPKVSFIVVQKRHHTRFRPKYPAEGVGRYRNVPPGTLLDKTITHKTDFDFYLCSHEGIQGTSRPTHYYTLWDENDLTSNELEVMTYYLCHVYARATRSVSIPAPVMYAHLAAYRGRQWVVGREGDDRTSQKTSLHLDSLEYIEQRDAKLKELNSLLRVSPELRTQMFYC